MSLVLQDLLNQCQLSDHVTTSINKCYSITFS